MSDELEELRKERVQFGKQSSSDYFNDEADRSSYMQYAPADEEDEEEEIQMQSSSKRTKISLEQTIANSRQTALEMENETTAISEQYGSGIVNTRISDRESEVSIIFSFMSLIFF